MFPSAANPAVGPSEYCSAGKTVALAIFSAGLGGSTFRWDFTRPAGSGPPPDIYVHRWTSSGFNRSGNCRVPKANDE